MKYTVVRTDTADEQIRKIILYINENFGSEVALQKLDELEESILHLGDHLDIRIIPRYGILRRQGYKVLVLEKTLCSTKWMKKEKEWLSMQLWIRDKII